jgi:hypothetical protein
MNFSNVSIVAALLALSSIACGSTATHEAQSPNPNRPYYISSTGKVTVLVKENDQRVKFATIACTGTTGTGMWLPAGHENETVPSTMDDAIGWMITNTYAGSVTTSITVVEQCSDGHSAETKRVAVSNNISLIPDNKLASNGK